jgi:putative membrane protein
MLRTFRLLIVAVVLGGGVAVADGPASDDDLASLAVRKSVSARADAGGTVTEAHLLTRLVADGDGQVRVTDPTSTRRLRDLDRAFGPRVRDGQAIWDLDLDGIEVRRTLARLPADELPIAVTARYTLDGEPVEPGDLRGASGDVTARYLVRNVTAEPRRITYGTVDGEVTEETDVAVPFVGRLIADVDERWTDVRSDSATIVAGPDGTQASWSMALFEPLGSLEHELELRGVLDGGGLPDVTVEFAPVTASSSAELTAGRDALADGQGDVAVLAFGLEESEEGLRDAAAGVGELLAGLSELGRGIGGLAEGAERSAEGAGALADGTAEAAGGAGALADGTAGAASGAADLAGGTGALAGGLGQLAAGIAELADGLAELRSGTGQLSAGSAELAAGADEFATGVEQAVAEIDTLLGLVPDLDPGALGEALASTVAVLEAVQETLAAQGPLRSTLGEVEAGAEEVLTILRGVRETADDPQRIDSAIVAGERIREAAQRGSGQLDTLTAELTGVLSGLATALQGAVDGLEQLGALDPAELVAGLDELAAGARALADGVDEVARGAAGIDAGIAAGAAGARDLAGGTAGATAGAREIESGAWMLAGGLGELANGTGELAAGLQQLATGAGELAAGLAQLAGGAAALASGIGQAVDGVSELEGGLQMLADEAIDLLRRAADAVGADIARDLARIGALEDRALDGVPYGVPDGAVASAGYRITLAGSSPYRLPPAGRAGLGLLLLGAAGAVATRALGAQGSAG